VYSEVMLEVKLRTRIEPVTQRKVKQDLLSDEEHYWKVMNDEYE
jgi:hypothetical protein